MHRDAIAAELQIEPTIVAPNSIRQDLARNPDTAADRLIAENRWCPWQWELIKPALVTV